ncbi:hypothetical protein JXL21_05055 [Candidatus Bathyarchaeota archaeon]|nr:hypothetical protein [Candidatus Bathyarchaeota archaeon]
MLARATDRSVELPLEKKVELIRSELEKRFPGHSIVVREWRNKRDTGIKIRWTDGPSLIDMIETGIRERFGFACLGGRHPSIPNCFVCYEREYSTEALASVESSSPWNSYDWALLAERSYDPEGKLVEA